MIPECAGPGPRVACDCGAVFWKMKKKHREKMLQIGQQTISAAFARLTHY